MTIWVLRDRDEYLTGAGGRIAVASVTSYSDVVEHHVDDFADEAAALAEAKTRNEAEGAHWEPVALDFPDASPEDFDEHFED